MTDHFRLGRGRLLGLGAAWLALVSPVGAAPFQTLALTGQPLAGRDDPLAFFFASEPDLTGNRAAFWALESGGAQVVWTAPEVGAGQAIAATGQWAPGVGGKIENLFLPAVARDGRVAFWSDLDRDQEVLWQWQAGSGLSPLAVSGRVAPGTGTTFATFFDPQPLTDGRAAFWAVTADLGQGIWQGTGPGDLTAVAVSGQTAPGSGGQFDAFSDPLTRGDDLYLVADLTDGRQGIWQRGTGGLTTVAHTGLVAPGSGSTFDLFFGSGGLPRPGGDGSLVFWSQLADGRQSLWQHKGAGDLVSLALAGEAAPGSGQSFLLLDAPAVNGQGEAAFVSTLSDFTQGLWLNASTGLLPVALEGQAVGGDTFAAFDRVLLDQAGGLVFQALTRQGQPGIWRYDPLLDLLDLIIRADQLLEVAPGDARRVTDLSLNGLNEAGRIAFWSAFDGGSQGLFLTAGVPLPASLALLLTGLLPVARRQLALAGNRCQPYCPNVP